MARSIEAQVLSWALGADTGLSSKCMAAHLTGNECDGHYPSDEGDLGRCLRLLAAAPELRGRLPKMAEVNRYWAALVARWDDLERSYADPSSDTYEMMKSILRPIEARDQNFIRLNSRVSMRFGGKVR